MWLDFGHVGLDARVILELETTNVGAGNCASLCLGVFDMRGSFGLNGMRVRGGYPDCLVKMRFDFSDNRGDGGMGEEGVDRSRELRGEC